MTIGRTPSRQLIDHAIQVVLQMRYRRAMRQVLPNSEDMIKRDARETGRGIKRIMRRGSKKALNSEKVLTRSLKSLA